jgi:Fe-S oxidoreductase
LCRSEWVAWQFGPRLNQAFAEVKQLFDRANRMNPGKIVSPPKMDDASLFRFPPGYRRSSFQPKLDWAAWDVERDAVTGAESAPGAGGDATHGLAKAIEMCNNNGHCRKFDAGTMCPSYRVTRDEQHTTRGRANTLRLALTGQLIGEDLAGEGVREALELCVSCKGCKRECPTGVDMAKLKIEATAARVAREGIALADRLVAYLPHYAPMLSRMPWAPMLYEHLPGSASAAERGLGLSSKRSLPRWRGDFLRNLGASGDALGPGREVLLFVDTFTNYFEPANASAALRVLKAAGYAVHTSRMRAARPLCCGRTFLSAGLVDEAKAEARRTLDALLPFARRGVAIVGLEPSCLLTMRDEFLDYRFGDDARLIAAHALLFEEFLAREKLESGLALRLRSVPAKEALLHGHCHQKALSTLAPVTEVLRWIPGLTTRVIESSCCGMAGAFGYEARHYDVSMAMAELSLLPAVRAASSSAQIVADGFSCRHQIRDGTGRDALHVARVLELALA